MKTWFLLAAILLIGAPSVPAHKPAGPVTTCQPATGEAYHDFLPPVVGFLVVAGDGNVEECGTTPERLQVLNDNGARCQQLKQIRDDPANEPELRQTASDLHTLLCTPHTLLNDRTADYDGELDHGHGGVFLAVNSGDGSTWGSEVCYGMQGHHSQNIYVIRWLLKGGGPAFTVTADFSRTPPSPGPKGTPADCGDSVVEPCDATPPPPSTQPFPVNVVIDTVNAQLWALFGPAGDGTTCNVDDCAERNPYSAWGGATASRSRPDGPTHLMTTCSPGIDGTLVVFIEPDPDAPDATQSGHVWTY